MSCSVLGGVDAAAPRVDGVGRVIRIGNHLVQRAVLQGDQSRQDLCDTGRIILHIHILIIKDGSAGCFHDNGGFRVDLRALGPAVDGVGIDILIISSLALGLDLLGGSLLRGDLRGRPFRGFFAASAETGLKQREPIREGSEDP